MLNPVVPTFIFYSGLWPLQSSQTLLNEAGVCLVSFSSEVINLLVKHESDERFEEEQVFTPNRLQMPMARDLR